MDPRKNVRMETGAGIPIPTLSVDRATAAVSVASDAVIEPKTLSSSANVIVCLNTNNSNNIKTSATRESLRQFVNIMSSWIPEERRV